MALQAGEQIGAYQIIAPLGQGGMATVFKAYHPRLNRHVAIKMLHHAYLEDPSFIARFEREAQIVAQLDHAHIVPVYDFSEHDGQPYLVMKFIEGCTLKEVLTDGALPPTDITKVMAAIAGALDYAHSKGVLHRDIKPSNIMLDKQATPYLSDFGLARITQAGESTLSQDMLLGTPYYMSPEQAAGRTDLDARSDLYALGVVLYELIVGKVPFSSGTPYAIMHDHIHRPLPLPREANPDVPEPVEQVLLKALAKERAERYDTAAHLLEAFNGAVSQSNLTPLQTERANTLAVSVTKARPPKTPQRPVAKPAAAVPAPLIDAPPEKPAPRSAKPTSRNSRQVRIALGIGGVLLLCTLVLAVGAANRRRNADDMVLPTLAVSMTPTPSVQLYTVPDLSVKDARAALDASADDPVAYLSLVKALLGEGKKTEAVQVFEQGASIAPNDPAYLLTAASSAAAEGLTVNAITLYAQALAQFEDNAGVYPFVRSMAGEYMYGVALNPGALSAADLRQLRNDTPLQDVPMLNAMLARILLSAERVRLADVAIADALKSDSTLPESHLILGELQAAQGNSEQARKEWEFVLTSADAPDWLKQRANELLGN